MARVLVTDSTFDRLDVEEPILRAAAATLDAGQCRSESDLIAAVSGADAVLTQFAPVTARVIAAIDRRRPRDRPLRDRRR